VVYYADARLRSQRQGRGLIARIVTLGAWLLILLLIASLLRELHARRMATLQAELSADQAAEAPAVAEPPPEEAAAAAPEPPDEGAASPPELMAAPPSAPVVPAVAEPQPPSARVVEVEIPPAANGNFYVQGEINQHKVLFVVDTGASLVAVPDKLRWTLKLARGRYLQSSTANGLTGMYETRIDSLSIGDLRLKNVAAVLNPNTMPNDVVLLGMSALREVRLTQQNGRLVLQQEIAPDPPPGAGEGAQGAPARPLALKKSVKECMGEDKVVNQRVLDCMKGAEEEEEAR
jgi:aspartyl protease family protein